MLSRVTDHAKRLDPDIDEAQVHVALLQIDKIWDQLFPAEQHRIVRLLIEKVVVTPHSIDVRFRPNGLEMVAREIKPRQSEEVAA